VSPKTERRTSRHARRARTRAGRAVVPPGFTLIELLVVIAIIATLAAVVAPSLFGNVGEARRSSAKSQIEILALALDAYKLDNEDFPTTQQGLDALRTMPAAGGTGVVNWKGPYLRQNVPVDPWRRPYVYVSPGVANPTSYDLYTLGKDGQVGGTGENSDITSWGGAPQ
jgi:general secretion pathway protein G